MLQPITISAETISKYLNNIGLVAACPTICCQGMNRDYALGKRIFKFFKNKYNLSWYADVSFEEGKSYPTKESDYIYLTLRDLRLSEIGIL